MAVFISYARNDRPAAETLRRHVETPTREVWLDENLTGGQNWWDTILSRIRECDVFLYALSLDSLDSRACRAELQYAEDLGRPILPVMVAAVAVELAPPTIAELQIVDYTTDTPETPVSLETALSLRNALDGMPAPGDLPDPLPDPPPAPISYMNRERELIDGEALSYAEQTVLVATLGPLLDRRDQGPVANELLRRLRDRPDVAQQVAKDIDALLPKPPPPPPPSRLSADLHPAIRRSRRGATFELEARNHGEMGVTATLAVTQETEAISLEVDPGTMIVGPGAASMATVQVTPRSPMLIGRRRKYPVRVAIGSNGSDPLVAEGAFVQEPWVRLPWLAIGGLLVVTTLVALAVWNNPQPTPDVAVLGVLKGEYEVTVTVATPVIGADLLVPAGNKFWMWDNPQQGEQEPDIWTLVSRCDDQPCDTTWDSQKLGDKFGLLQRDGGTYTEHRQGTAHCDPDPATVDRSIDLRVTHSANISGVWTATEIMGEIDIMWTCNGQLVSGTLSFEGSKIVPSVAAPSHSTVTL